MMALSPWRETRGRLARLSAALRAQVVLPGARSSCHRTKDMRTVSFTATFIGGQAVFSFVPFRAGRLGVARMGTLAHGA